MTKTSLIPDHIHVDACKRLKYSTVAYRCKIINDMTADQRAAVDLYGNSQFKYGRDKGYDKGYEDGKLRGAQEERSYLKD